MTAIGVEELLETVPVCKRARKRLRAVVTSEDEQDSSIRLIFASGGSSPRFDDGLYIYMKIIFPLNCSTYGRHARSESGIHS